MAIDIGAPATDRATYQAFGWTLIAKDNPANASGTITSVELWFDFITAEGVTVGTFYTTNGNTLKCRDSELIGNVSAGSKQTKPVTIAVEAGDYIGVYFTNGYISKDDTGGAGVWGINAEHKDPDDEATYTWFASWVMSLYGTGEEAAITKIADEIVGITDSLIKRAWSIRLFSETAGITESSVRKSRLTKIFSEAINITETMFWVFLATFTETVGIAESLTRTAGITKVFSEAIAIADGLVKRFWATRLITESLSIADSAIKRLWSIRLMVETVGIADDLVRRLRSVRIITESLSIVEGFVKHIVGLVNIFSHESGVGQERASRVGWLMKPSVYTKEPFELKTYTGE